MIYINQLEYPHIPYNHNMAHGGPPAGRNSVKTSGCGLCCAAMVVDQLTDKSLTVEEAVRLSEDKGANLDIGTDMKIMGNLVAERFGLEASYTSDVDEAIECLQKGGRVIALVGGSRDDGYVGLFAKSGHYVLLVSYDGNEFCILDPALTETKYTEEGRVGRARVEHPFVYSTKEEIMLATKAYTRRYYLFSRKHI